MESNKRIRFLMLVLGIVVAALVLASFLVPKGVDVLWLNGHHTPTLDFFFYYVTALGHGIILFAILIPALFLNFRFALTTLVAFAFSGIASRVLKTWLQLPRPAKLLDSDLIHVVYDVNLHTNNSFPSGHTLTAFCVATLLAFKTNSRAWVLILAGLATLVGVSRIYLGQHFLLDVAAGAFLGSGIGLLTSLLFQKMRYSWLDRHFTVSLPSKKIANWPNMANE